MEGLHPTRLKVLRFLARRMGERKETPTQREVGRAAGFSSAQTAAYHLSKLEADGYIERGEAPSRKRRPLALTEKGWGAVGEMRMLGWIAAGDGMEAVPIEETYSVFGEFFAAASGKERFFLRARGDSMTGAGISDGDPLLIEADESPPDGTVVAALLESGEGTVKWLYREEENVRLRPDNEAYEDIVLPAGEVRIQGRVELVLHRPRR